MALYGKLSAWRDWLLTSDPGLSRFRFAARITLSVVLALLVLLAFTRAVGQGLPVMLLGVIVSMLSAATVNDPEPRQQRLTMLLMPLSAAAAVTLGALLAPSRYLGDAGFVGVMFAAVYIRRFGPRGFALGMLAFIPYFFALFLRVTVSQLPWMVLAILLGTACSYLMRFVILPERPEATLERTLRAFKARVGQIVEAVQAMLAGAGQRDALPRLVTRLNDTAFMVEGQLDSEPLRSSAGESLLLKVFDLELAAQRLAAASTAAVPAPLKERLLPVLRDLQRVLQDDDVREPLPEFGERKTREAQDRLSLAVRDLASAIRALPTSGSLPDSPRASDGGEAKAQQQDESGEEERGLPPSTRQAIQAALAGALAISGGELISPSRWYWAAITGFIVFTGTNSRGEVLVKGWQRVLGTFAGVVAGVFIATAVRGNRGVSIPLVLACIFLAFYFIRVSYALMIFWFTILLALLYGLLGSFTPHLLLVRLEETALGAVVGILVALWVLPMRTRTKVAEAGQAFLSALSDVVGGFAETLEGSSPLTPQLRELDGNLRKLHDAAAPLTRGIGGALGRSSVRRWLRELGICRYEAHSLAQLSQRRSPEGALDPRILLMLSEIALRVRDNTQALALLAGGHEAPALQPAREPVYRIETALKGDHRAASARALAAAHCLKRLDQIVCGLARDYYSDRKVDDPRPKVEY